MKTQPESKVAAPAHMESQGQPIRFFHWPDRVIGKRESRRIRESHNRTVNELLAVNEDLLAALDLCEQNLASLMLALKGNGVDTPKAFAAYETARAAIAKAKGVRS